MGLERVARRLRGVPMSAGGWIGVDFDGTLSQYHGWHGKGRYGPPVPAMLARVQQWLVDGLTVKIMTARAVDEAQHVQAWLEKHGLPALEVTDRKDYGMRELWDDRAVQVIPNTGERADGKP